jgi:O-antigen/teichoic acid export membrane protein
MTDLLTNNMPDSSGPLLEDHKDSGGPADAKIRPSFFANLVTVFGGQIACAVLALLIEVCYARFLGPEGRGQISLALMAVTLGVLIGGLGGEIPITVWTADAKKDVSNWLPAVLFSGALGCIVAMCIWVLAYWRWQGLFFKGITPILFVLVLATIPAMVLFGHLCALLAGAERFRARAGLSFLEQLAGLIGILGLILLVRRSSEMALLGNLVGLVVGAGAVALTLRKSLRRIGNLSGAWKHVLPALCLGTRGQLGNLATFFNYRLDVFIVNAFLNPAHVGLYAVGVVASEALWQVPNAAAVALLPRTARTVNAGSTEFTCSILRQVLLIAFGSGVVLAVLSPFVIPAVFGAAFRESVSVIWWILPGTIALCLGKVISADLAGRKKPQYSSIFALISLAVTVVLDFKLIPVMGIRGAALASSTAYLLDSFLLAVALKHELQVSWKFLLIPSRSEFDIHRLALLRFFSWVGRHSLLRAASTSDRSFI